MSVRLTIPLLIVLIASLGCSGSSPADPAPRETGPSIRIAAASDLKFVLPVLIEQCTALGKRQMVAVIGDSAQTPSIRLHASCGFEMVGTLRNIGFKFNRWLDSVLMQRELGVGSSTPPGSA